MKSIILFRFHKKPLVCKSRIRLLKKMNPNMEIYGLYGGSHKDFKRFKKYLKHDLINIYKLKPRPNILGSFSASKGKPIEVSQAWLNGDLSLREWYLNFGKTLEFERIYVIEWDVLALSPLEKMLSHIPSEALGLVHLVSINHNKKWDWLNFQPWKNFYKELLIRVKCKYDFDENKELVCFFPLSVFPRKFLEDYSKIKIECKIYHGKLVPLCHDEIRLPMYGQILKHKMMDNNIPIQKFFSSGDGEGIELEDIKKELAKEKGSRVFHPYTKIIRF